MLFACGWLFVFSDLLMVLVDYVNSVVMYRCIACMVWIILRLVVCYGVVAVVVVWFAGSVVVCCLILSLQCCVLLCFCFGLWGLLCCLCCLSVLCWLCVIV